LKYLGSCFQIN
jgi:hypothetical protein